MEGLNGKQLRLLRKHLMITAQDAAKHIAGVELRTWLRWEKGVHPIPKHIIADMIAINCARVRRQKEAIRKLNRKTSLKSQLASMEEFINKQPRNTADKLINESVLAGVYSEMLAI